MSSGATRFEIIVSTIILGVFLTGAAYGGVLYLLEALDKKEKAKEKRGR